MCGSCSNPAKAKGLCSSCYNKKFWASASPEQLQKRRDAVRKNKASHASGTFKRDILESPTEQETRLRVNKFVRERRAYIQHIVNDIKIQLGCIDCGYNTNAIALDFDHVKGQKNFGISKAISRAYSLEKIFSEIEKCEVRCANCHRVVTLQRKQI
jgi:hypothetical protein